jgi:cell division septum initiation protein DivIVA
MPIRPEEIDPSKLPGAFRGYDRAATDELLKRVAWDYRQVLRVEENWAHEKERLLSQIADLEARVESQQAEFTRALTERSASLEGAANSKTVALEAEVGRLERVLRRHEQRRDLTETLLETAKRSARELRESAREEAETLLKSAQRRAAEIEQDARSDARHATAELGRLQKLESDLRDRLRDTLEAVIGDNGNQVAADDAAAEPDPAP